jgi:hypothetical protein
MSLKSFHVVFIAASILLAFGFGAWELVQYSRAGATTDLAFGVGSLAVGVTLVVYGRYFLKKLKDISYL